MRAELGLPLDAAEGAVLLTCLGVVLSSATSGYLRARIGTGAVLVGSTTLAATALAATSLAPTYAAALAATRAWRRCRGWQELPADGSRR